MGGGLIKRRFIVYILATVFSLLFSGQAVFATDGISLTLSPDPVVLNIVPGVFGSANQTIIASTTNIAGYTINLKTSGSSTDLVNTEDSTITVPTFTLPSGSSSIPVANIGDGYGYSVDNGANFLPVPSPSSSNYLFSSSSAGENTHILQFGAKIPEGTPAGSYVYTFIIQVVVNLEPCAANSICYYGNGDDGTGAMANQSVTSNASATLIPSNYSRPGYGFVGWNTELDGSGTNYGPNETITTGDLSVEGLQLYAKWVQSSGNLQGWNGCDSLSTGEVIALTDTRDNNTYAVTKYTDGHCWMMENLRLDLSNEDIEISELSTNNPTSDFATAVNSHPSSTNSFCITTSAACIDQILYNTNNTNRNLTSSYNANNATSSWYSYGTYYNWYAATAGNGTYSFATAGEAVEGDICPAGWRLPTGGSGSEYHYLNSVINSGRTNVDSGIRAYPNNFVYSGEYNENAPAGRGAHGRYWSSTTSSNKDAFRFGFTVDAVTPIKAYSKWDAFSVRCIASGDYSAIGNIHYDSNGGTGTMSDEEEVDLATAVAADNGFTRTGYAFMGWNTSADGTGITVLAGASVAAAANHMGITHDGTLTLYAIWQQSYRVVYNGNGADYGSMSNVVHSNPSGSLKLIAPNFLYTDYGFAGWSTDSDAATKLTSGQAVTIYGPNETIAVDNAFLANADSNSIITLYAVWLPADADYTLQTFGSNECDALSVGDILALTDERDNNVYSVAKLNDNHCWMIESLRLDPSTTTFSDDNTNLPTADFVANAPSSSSSTTLCGQDNSSCINRVAFNANNLDSSLSASYYQNNSTSYWYSYGVMYNWYTATAGNGTFSTASDSVEGDICPKGWRLPTGGSGGELQALNVAINSGLTGKDDGIRAFPNNFIHSGDYNKTTTGGRGTYGRYWSATAASSQNAFRFGFTTNEVTPVKSFNKWDAFAVRCIVKEAE